MVYFNFEFDLIVLMIRCGNLISWFHQKVADLDPHFFQNMVFHNDLKGLYAHSLFIIK